MNELTVTLNTIARGTGRVAAILEVEGHEDPLPQHFMEGMRLDPIAIGRHGGFRIDHESVLPVHGYIAFDGNVVAICSFDHRRPLFVNGLPIPSGRWTPLAMPCQIQIGAVGARLRRPSMVSATPASFDPEVTRCDIATPKGTVRAMPASFDSEVTRFDIPAPAKTARAKESRAPARSPRRKRRAGLIAACILLASVAAAGATRLRAPAPAPVPVESTLDPSASTAGASSEQEEETLGTVVLTTPPMSAPQERAAADALRRGDREAALAIYTKLAKEHPAHPAFGRITRMIN